MLRTMFALFFCVAVLVGMRADAGETDRIGKKIDNFSLKNQFGKEYSLDDVKDAEVVVVAFLGAECPLAKLYGPRLAELAKSLDAKRVAFLGIDPNQQDSIQKIAAYAQRHNIEFPVLKDPGNVVADRFGAERTPEIFVLDRERVVRYWGRVDDQYGFAEGVGYQRPAPSRHDLVEAVNELLDGKQVSVATTKAIGCIIGRVRPVNDDSKVTYSNQIARIFQNHCVECHRPGRIGPFAMTSYDEVLGWGEMIGEVVQDQRMPPWHANPLHSRFSNDLSLSDSDKELIAEWVKDGCPEGNPADLPSPREFAEGWAIGDPDQILYMSDKSVSVPAEGVIDYYHFVVDPGWTEDKWLTAAEAKPGSLETVHHILVFVLPPGVDGLAGRTNPNGPRRGGAGESDANQKGNDTPRGFAGFGRRGGGRGGSGIASGDLIAGYAPGGIPFLNTDGKSAMPIKAGSKLLFQMHYTPNGTPAEDRSYIGLKFADPNKVEFAVRSMALVNPLFAIPPGASDYQVASESMFEVDTLLINMTPHMHTRGKAFRYEVVYPDGRQEIVLDVPRYDFNWQTTYILDEPKLVPKGTKLICTAHWDNSEENLSNPDPTKTVTWGNQTFEEMNIGFYVEVFPKDQIPPRPSPASMLTQFTPEKVFAALDGNKDGKLTKEELPERIGQFFQVVDQNRDGEVSMQEMELLLKLLGSFRGGGRGGN